MVAPTGGFLDDQLDAHDERAYAPTELRETFVIVSFEAHVDHWRDAYEWARLHGVTQILPLVIVNEPDRKGGLVAYGITRQRLRAVLDLVGNDGRINEPS